MFEPSLLFFYATPLVLLFGINYLSRRRSSKRAQSVLRDAVESGLTEPASLHPTIDHSLCCGAGACVRACPEKEVIGIIGGKAQLIEPTACIGHGACAAACPTQAIRLVFGTEERGVDLPNVNPDFETNVPGLFIAGELGGMGLIRNAIEQGRQAMDNISRKTKRSHGDALDVLIIGAGPAGFSASLAAKSLGLSYQTLEQDSFGGTVAHFPRGKLIMTQPAELPIVGKVKFSEISKEKLLSFWNDIREQNDLDIAYEEGLLHLERTTECFQIQTTKRVLKASSVLLAIGRRGTPRKLNIPGEDLPKVVYKMIDPEQYQNQSVLVVGGGDSALEAAASIAEQPDTMVTLSYRGAAFSRAKRKNRARVEQLSASGRLSIVMHGTATEILPNQASIETETETLTIQNDHVIICAGGILPTSLLTNIGVEMVTKFGEA